MARALQGALDIALFLNGNGFPGALPTGFDATTYTSLLKVAQNLVATAVLPLTVGNQLLTGQFDKISPTINTTLTTLFTSVTQGLPTSIAQTLHWVFTGQTPPDATTMTATAATVDSLNASKESTRAGRPRRASWTRPIARP